MTQAHPQRPYLRNTFRCAVFTSALGLAFLLLASVLMIDNLWAPSTVIVPGAHLFVDDTFRLLRGGVYWLEFHAPIVDENDTRNVDCALNIEIGGDQTSTNQEVHQLEYSGIIPAFHQQIYTAVTDVPHENVRIPLSSGEHYIRLTGLSCDALNQRGATMSLSLSGDPTGYVVLKQLSFIIGSVLMIPGVLLTITVLLLSAARRLKLP